MLAVGIILRGDRGLMISAFFLILIISTALLFGNEFSVGFFIHPSLTRADHRAFLPAIQVFARFFGKSCQLDGRNVALPSFIALVDLAMAGLPHSISYFGRHSLDHNRCV
jgi:hypothetical protein